MRSLVPGTSAPSWAPASTSNWRRTLGVPIVISGFEPVDILEGILMAVRQLEDGRGELENQYRRVVTRRGNESARALVDRVFETSDRNWRGVGEIPASGLRMRDEYRAYDAARIFEVETITTREAEVCISGEILRGWKKPPDCPAFGTACTPAAPLGATMVSDEGACAAYYSYRRRTDV